MFPYERFYGFLKSLVHNRLFPEGAIVRGYETIEAMEWAMGYMDPQNPIGVPLSRHEGRLSGVGTMGKRSVTPDADVFKKAHFTVIQQLHLITPFAMSTNDNYVKTTLIMVGLSLQRCTCNVSAGGSEIMLRHAAIML
jgi:hypothetical protein